MIISSQVMCKAMRLATLAERIDPNPNIEGFHLTFLSRSSQGVIEIAQAPIGTIRNPWGGPEGIRAYSNEKALRLAAHRIRDSSVLSSYQTRDSQLGMYQGAVLFPSDCSLGFSIVSVSAYEEPMDEAVALVLGEEMGVGNRESAREIADISDNQVYSQLRRAFYDRSW